jgi:hypothetical protein
MQIKLEKVDDIELKFENQLVNIYVGNEGLVIVIRYSGWLASQYVFDDSDREGQTRLKLR